MKIKKEQCSFQQNVWTLSDKPVEAKYRGIPCYYTESTHKLQGRNKFCDILLSLRIWWDVNITGVAKFEIKIKK